MLFDAEFQNRVEHLIELAEKLDKYRLCMSYFGEPEGLVKHVVREMSHVAGKLRTAMQQPDTVVDEQRMHDYIENAIGFEFAEGELQSVNASDLMQLVRPLFDRLKTQGILINVLTSVE